MAWDLKGQSLIRGTLQRITQRVLTGTFLVFPFAATMIVLFWIINGSDKIVRALLNTVGLPEHITWHPVFSVIAALMILYLIGMLSTLFVVRKLISFGESLVRRIPVVNFIYNTTKQIIEAISLQSRQSFKKVVLVEYPRKGVYAMAFMTGQTPREADDAEPLINVFLPTTPNPTSGFFLLLPRTEVLDTNLTIEEGVKMIISGGILTPKPLGTMKITKEELEKISQQSAAGQAGEPAFAPASAPAPAASTVSTASAPQAGPGAGTPSHPVASADPPSSGSGKI
ncbi:MAG: hypothetical protein Kow0059_02610 [Candidatus Sumerlaeia bacterium]